LGHGVGLEIHENPRISVKSPSLLELGMVVTVEPGVYLPGQFGIRVEDMVLVTKEGCEVLSGNYY
jgi:Xaa-Pro aminopeptidase